MNEYRKKVLSIYSVMDDVKFKRKEIVNSGLSDVKMKNLLHELKEQTKARVEALQAELTAMANLNADLANKEVIEAQRQGKDPSLMLYHQNRARAKFDGHTEDKLVGKYDEVASTLLDDEKKYLFVYEDELKSRVKPSVDTESVFWPHKTIEEKVARSKKQGAEKFIDTTKTITGLMEMEVGEILDGHKTAGHDFASILDEMTK